MKPSPSREARSDPQYPSLRKILAAASIGGVMTLSGPVFGAHPALPVAASKWDRAKALDAAIDDAVRGGHIIGATVIAAQDDAVVYQRAAGYADREARRPMVEDEICRLASMTKAIVCVAALSLC